MTNSSEGNSGAGPNPERARVSLERFDGELDAEYQGFVDLVNGFAQDTSPEAQGILKSGAALAGNTDNSPKAHNEEMPTAARQEQELALAQGNMAPAAEQTEQAEPSKKHRLRRLGVYGCIAAMAATATAIFGIAVRTDNAEAGPGAEVVVTNAASLRALGICATDMRMQLEYDKKRAYAPSVRNGRQDKLRLDRIAIKTAEKAEIPCVKYPRTDAFVVTQDNPERNEVTSLYRGAFTDFVSANWPAQRAELRHKINTAGEDGDYLIYQNQIDAGNTVFASLANPSK